MKRRRSRKLKLRCAAPARPEIVASKPYSGKNEPSLNGVFRMEASLKAAIDSGLTRRGAFMADYAALRRGKRRRKRPGPISKQRPATNQNQPNSFVCTGARHFFPAFKMGWRVHNTGGLAMSKSKDGSTRRKFIKDVTLSTRL